MMFTPAYNDYYKRSHRLSWTKALLAIRVPLWMVALTLVVVAVAIWRTTRIGRTRILEKAYFKHRNEKVEGFDSSQTSRALALPYNCQPLCIGDKAFPVALLWENSNKVIHPDQILGTLEPPPVDPFVRSPNLNDKEYAAARRNSQIRSRSRSDQVRRLRVLHEEHRSGQDVAAD